MTLIIDGGDAFSPRPEILFDTFWDVDGVSLQTYAYNIETWGSTGTGGGGRETPPPPRGSNVVVLGRLGQQYQPKVPDSRVITISMWVIGSNPDGTAPVDGNLRASFEHNFKTLRNLLMRPYKQFQLTKRFREYGSDAVVTATALAEFSTGLDVQMTGELRGIFTVDLLLADPYFYEPAVNTPPLTTTAPVALNLTGDARSFKVTADMQGPMVNPKLTIVGPENTCWAQLTDNINTGEVATLDSYNKRALHNNKVVSTKVTHAGSSLWLFIEPGINTFTLSALSGSGSATLSYQKAHL